MAHVGEADRVSAQGRHRLISGDCLTVLPSLDAGTVDVVVTSPPYNLGIAYRDYYDRMSEEEYLDWLMRVARELRRVMKADASFFLTSPARRVLLGCRLNWSSDSGRCSCCRTISPGSSRSPPRAMRSVISSRWVGNVSFTTTTSTSFT